VMREIVGLDLLDDRAVIGVRQHAGDGMLQIETLSENQRRHQGFGWLMADGYG
jgi:hypothetical protein